ncbi:ElyC/SanA/YdcF family protein [Desulfovibrio inopinatus]|uniref:ElyC/SanA/YdcF family protein n=1 Tax=Desulfovibrio inopinatus TaxID=102109 RepID=UPI0004186FFF|nr:ElyC/SanA/YdcF family protein [Desulfovibrio inopinatus]
MFIFKKFVSRFLFPFPLGLEFLAIGLYLHVFTTRKKAGIGFLFTGFFWLLLISTDPLPSALLTGLESRFPPFNPVVYAEHHRASLPSYVAVLGGGSYDDFDLPLSSRLSEASLARLSEGVIIAKTLGAKMVFAAGNVCDQRETEAEVMSQISVLFGIPPEKIRIDTASRDTATELAAIKTLVVDAPFVLVTSAAHMPRAMALASALGLHPIPAPANFLTHNATRCSWEFFPNPQNIRKTRRAFYEYLGLAWATLRGRV